jgi:hypothetical protein
MAFDPVKRSFKPLPPLRNSEAMAVVDDLLDHYLAMTTYSLVDLTHRPGTPWSRTVEAAESSVNIGMKFPMTQSGSFLRGQQNVIRDRHAPDNWDNNRLGYGTQAN